MKVWKKISFSFVPFTIALLCAACSGDAGSGQELQAPSGANPQQAELRMPPADSAAAVPEDGQLPAFPADREGQGITDYVTLGADAESKSAAAAVVETKLELHAENEGIAWGLWRFSPHAGQMGRLDVILELGKGDQAWLLLPDYKTGRWSPWGPFLQSDSVPIDRATNISPSGDLTAAILVYGSNTAIVSALSLRAFSTDGQPPLVHLTADLTEGSAPLAVSFDASESSDPGGAISHYLWDFDGDGVFEGLSMEAQITHTYEAGGNFSPAVMAVDIDGDTAQASLLLDINTPPLASLSLSRVSLYQDELLEVYASGSSDSDGSIEDYRWDLNGDGVFDSSHQETRFRGQSQIDLSPGLPGFWTLAVEITDDHGASSRAFAEYEVHGFETLVVHPGESFAGGIGMIPNGDGSVSMTYSDEDEGIYFSEVDTVGEWPTTPTQQAVVNAIPVLGGTELDSVKTSGGNSLLYVGTDYNLRYIVGYGEDSATQEEAVVLDTYGGIYGLSLTTVDGNPAAAYRWGDHLRYRFSQSNDGALLSDWTAPIDLAGIYACSIADLDDGPAILGRSSDSLLLHYSCDPLGAVLESWSTVTIKAGDTPFAPVLAKVKGDPACVFIEGSEVFFAKSSSPASPWNEAPVNSFKTPLKLSFAVIDGRPCVAVLSYEGLSVCWSEEETGLGAWQTFPALEASYRLPACMDLCRINEAPVVAFIGREGLTLARLM